MELIENQLLQFIDMKTCSSLRACSSHMLGNLKFKICKIEIWWKSILHNRWIKDIYESVSLPHKKQPIICKLCKTHPVTEAVYMNTKIIFSCFRCYYGIECDVINEVYPQMYQPLHTTYSTGEIEFKNMVVEEFVRHINEDIDRDVYENCRTQ